MKQYFKFSLLIVLITLSGSVFAQRNTPVDIHEEEKQAFRSEMNRLDSICNSSNPRRIDHANNADKWYEPTSMTLFNIKGDPTYRHSWTYEDASSTETRNVITEIFENWNAEESKYINDRRLTYIYDANGNWIQADIENWDGYAWVKNHISVCTYDEKNRMTHQVRSTLWEGEWKEFMKWTNLWDDADRLIDRMFEQATIDGIWVKTLHQIWEYDTKGNLLKDGTESYKVKPDSSGYHWTKFTGWTYTYDEAGYRATAVATNNNVSTWYVSREAYTHDAL